MKCFDKFCSRGSAVDNVVEGIFVNSVVEGLSLARVDPSSKVVAVSVTKTFPGYSSEEEVVSFAPVYFSSVSFLKCFDKFLRSFFFQFYTIGSTFSFSKVNIYISVF